MTRLASVLAFVLVCVACTSSPSSPPPIVVPDQPRASASTTASSPPIVTAPPPSTDASVAAEVPKEAGACDEDAAPAFDCARLNLGQCVAAEYYACPKKARIPEGLGFRRGPAARIGKCLAGPSFAPDDTCFKATEACVRDAVRATCIDPSTIATCERELSSCDAELKTLCAKFLSSLEPQQRDKALRDLASQRKNKKSCAFSWDLNGFPFCPFCPFR